MSAIAFYYESNHKKGLYVPPHSHNCWELVYYIGCSGVTHIGEKEFLFEPHTFALLPPYRSHDEQHERDGKLCYIGFEESDVAFQEGVYADDADGTFFHLIERIFSECRNRPPHAEDMLDLLIRELSLLLRRLKNPKKHPTQDLSFARRFLEENYHTGVRFSDLARSCGYGYDYFRHKFKEAYGVSPQSYLIALRLAHAKQLLEEGLKNCTEIAYVCGFSDSAQFSTMFRRAFGVSPKAYAKGERTTQS